MGSRKNNWRKRTKWGKVRSHLVSEKLKNLDSKFNIKWRSYKIEDIFISQTGDFDIQSRHINGKGKIVISSGLKGRGIIGKTDIEAKLFPKGTITVDMFGNAFFRNEDYKMVTHGRVFSLSLKDQEMDEK